MSHDWCRVRHASRKFPRKNSPVRFVCVLQYEARLAAHRQPLVPGLDESLGYGGSDSDGSARRLKVSTHRCSGGPCVLPGGEVIHSDSWILIMVQVRDHVVDG